MGGLISCRALAALELLELLAEFVRRTVKFANLSNELIDKVVSIRDFLPLLVDCLHHAIMLLLEFEKPVDLIFLRLIYLDSLLLLPELRSLILFADLFVDLPDPLIFLFFDHLIDYLYAVFLLLLKLSKTLINICDNFIDFLSI